MKRKAMKKLIVLTASLGLLATLLAPSPALASGGAFTQTMHVNSLFLPLIPPPTAPPSCPVQLPVAMISNSGNGVEHLAVNGTGDWFTTTFEGDASIFPFLGFDPAGNPILGAPTFQGHLTTWFGTADNNQNNVFHTTLDYHGTSLSSPAQTVDLHANFGVTTNASGRLTAAPINITCN
jgi:hypothetical protein